MLAVLRNPDFGLLWAGMGVSVVGDGSYQAALVWQVYGLSDTPIALAIVGAAALQPHRELHGCPRPRHDPALTQSRAITLAAGSGRRMDRPIAGHIVRRQETSSSLSAAMAYLCK